MDVPKKIDLSTNAKDPALEQPVVNVNIGPKPEGTKTTLSFEELTREK